MYNNPMHHHGHQGPQVLYQADPQWQSVIKHKREELMHALHPHIGRTIRVTTIDGHTHEGVLINADGHHVYLQVSSHGHHHGQHDGQGRPIYTPAQFQILSLVLFELLVILLYS